MLLIEALPLVLAVLALIALTTAIRWGGRLLIAGLAALATWAFVPGEGWAPLLVFVAVLLFGGRRRRRGAPRPGLASVAPAAEDTPWAAVRRLADWGQRRRLDAARLTCERYLALATTAEGESALLPIKLERHVPALLADCATHCASATRDEQRQLVEQALASVEAVADQAEHRRLELAHDAQSRFRALQAHLARRDE